jgi:hypothetical protein
MEEKFLLELDAKNNPMSYNHKNKAIGFDVGKDHPNFGKPLKDETRQKISNSLKGRKLTDDQRKKLSESLKKLPPNLSSAFPATFSAF